MFVIVLKSRTGRIERHGRRRIIRQKAYFYLLFYRKRCIVRFQLNIYAHNKYIESDKVILTGAAITKAVDQGTITLVPFDKGLVNPNSYNYRLGDELLIFDASALDVHTQPMMTRIVIPKEGYVLRPGVVYLGHTYETIGSSAYVPSLIGRSSLGRLGLFLQITADLGHLGTSHCWTLELKVVQPLRVYPNMRIGQVSFWQAEGMAQLSGKSYKEQAGSYAHYSGSTPSVVTKFFE